jgi:hypothetical protein
MRWELEEMGEGADMRRPVRFIIALILLVACSGCFWGWGHDQRGYEDRGRGGYGDQDHRGYGEQDHGGYGDQR